MTVVVAAMQSKARVGVLQIAPMTAAIGLTRTSTVRTFS
jgi:hypothetical protein